MLDNDTNMLDNGKRCRNKLATTCWYAGDTQNKWCQTKKRTEEKEMESRPICATLGPRKLAAGMSVIMLIGLFITWYVYWYVQDCDLRV